jgi:hypothetical protein
VLKDSKNNYESTNKTSLEFDIQRHLDVNLTSSLDDNYYFDIKDAIPITLNVESFIFIKTDCKHNIHHIFRLPVKTEIKWKIKGGTENGAFKIGGGMDAEYFPRDYGDSVIFYPQLKNTSKDTTYKNICIYLTINQLGSTLFEQQEYKFIVNLNILMIRKFLKRNYRVKMFVSKLDNNNDDDKDYYDERNKNKVEEDDDDEYSSNILNSNIPSNDELKSITKVEQDGNLILFKSFNSCKICNLMVIVKSNETSFFIKFFKKYLITTEIIKISASYNNNNTVGKKINNNYYNNNNNGSVLFTGTNYKKYFLDGVNIEPRLLWKSNSGKLVYGNLGQSLIYYTPGEDDLSKSPLTLNLYFQYDHSLEDLKQENLLDSKKFWILRQPPLMGG